MSFGFIYKIQFPNGKHYIGLTTTSLEQRKVQHKSRAKNDGTKYLYNAIRKYDMVDTFELIEIDKADTLEELCKKEIMYIAEYNSYYMNRNGYNMTYGGEGNNGYVYTEEDKQKQSERMTAYYINNPGARQKNSETTTNYFKNPVARQKQSAAQKKRFEKPEEKQICSEAQKKYHENNPHARQKTSEQVKNYFKNNPNARQKILDAKGKNKPFDVFGVDGTFIKTFTYQFEAMEYLRKERKITSTIKISAVLAGKRNNSAGFIFKYK